MWFYLAVLSALFNATSNIARRTHGSLAQPAELAWWSLLFSMPLGIGLVLISGEPLYSSTNFIVPATIAATISCYGSVLIYRAYKYGDASVISPLSNLVPIGLVITSIVILGIFPHLWGLVGILLVVAGMYYSSVSGRHSLAHPLRQLIKNRGSRAMIGWVAIASLVTAIVGLALRSASPSFLLLYMQTCEWLILSIYLLCRPQKHRIRHGERVIRTWGWHITAIAVFSTLSVLFQYKAMSMVEPSYVLSVKRLDVLFTVLMAGLFLHERHTLRRFKGAAIGLLGVIIILIAG